jgi:PASTA domain
VVAREGSRIRWLLVAIAVAVFVSAWAGAMVEKAPAGICTKNCPEGEEGGDRNPPVQPKVPTLLVVNVGWDSGNPATSAPLSPSRLENTIEHLRNVVNPWFKAMAPGFREWTVIGGGAYMIPPPKILFNGGCTILPATWNGFFKDVRESGDAAVTAAGYDPDSYYSTIYVWGPKVCTFEGIHNESTGRIGLPTIKAARHELGHRLGLDHNNLLDCHDETGLKPLPPLTGNCFPAEYGDPYDTMGNSADGLFNVIFQDSLGYLTNQVVRINGGDFTQSVTLKPLSEIGKSPRAVRLVDGSTTLWLEYRQPTGLDDPAVTGAKDVTYGLVIHRELDRGAGKRPGAQLLDISPETPAKDPVLRLGQTWANPLGEMTIRLDGESPTGATVTISSRRVTMPDLRGLTVAQAEARLAGAGLKLTGLGGVVDPTCAFVGLVAAQSPFPGLRILPENPVSVSIGERDPNNQCQ